MGGIIFYAGYLIPRLENRFPFVLILLVCGARVFTSRFGFINNPTFPLEIPVVNAGSIDED